ncbi:hypothetical protein GCM10022214_81940 [Actinomadura miaoliensis]|uniref:Uncharacterized protein n=1 Tax=Actinomadura miaoliensis TaxID=430685 RepID=A0ABP7X2S0_9ACTN
MSRPGWPEGAFALGAHLASWKAGVAALALLVAVFGYRLLAERARRETLRVTYREAPGGTVVVQEEGPGGPAMWVRIGDGQRPEPPGGARRAALPPRRP